jgi:hypothetical protein
MPRRTSSTGSELFIVDNSHEDWKVLRYLHDWCQLSKSIDIATGYFEIGSLLALQDEWQKVDHIRILMGDEVSRRTMAKSGGELLTAYRQAAALDGRLKQHKDD